MNDAAHQQTLSQTVSALTWNLPFIVMSLIAVLVVIIKWRHASGFVSLLVISVAHLAGNIALIVLALRDSPSSDVVLAIVSGVFRVATVLFLLFVVVVRSKDSRFANPDDVSASPPEIPEPENTAPTSAFTVWMNTTERVQGAGPSPLASPPGSPAHASDARPSRPHTSPTDEGEGPHPYPPENVQFTSFCPRRISWHAWKKMLVYAHLDSGPPDQPTPLEKLRAEAAHLLQDEMGQYVDVTKDSRSLIPREAEIQFVPQAPGVRFNPPIRKFFWAEGSDLHREEFEVRAEPTAAPSIAGSITVWVGVLLVAELPLRIQSTPKEADAEEDDEEQSHATPYRNIFPSYSRQDDPIVRQIESYAATLGDRFLKDVTELRSGEAWSPRLLELIQGADVFQLFWSNRSAESREVEREWRHALSLQRPNFIRPTYWEHPLPTVPGELGHVHFQKLAISGATAPAWQAPPFAEMPEEPVALDTGHTPDFPQTEIVPPPAAVPEETSTLVINRPLEIPPTPSVPPLAEPPVEAKTRVVDRPLDTPPVAPPETPPAPPLAEPPGETKTRVVDRPRDTPQISPRAEERQENDIQDSNRARDIPTDPASHQTIESETLHLPDQYDHTFAADPRLHSPPPALPPAEPLDDDDRKTRVIRRPLDTPQGLQPEKPSDPEGTRRLEQDEHTRTADHRIHAPIQGASTAPKPPGPPPAQEALTKVLWRPKREESASIPLVTAEERALEEVKEKARLDPVVGWLVVIVGPGRGQAVPLGYGMNTIGRDASQRARVDFGDDGISRFNQARVVYHPRARKFFITPGDGVNLTYLATPDGSSIDALLVPTELQPGVIIQMGETALRFVPLCGPDFDWQEVV